MPRRTQVLPRPFLSFRIRECHPLRFTFPGDSPMIFLRLHRQPYNPVYATVWAPPVSLATTPGMSLPAGTEMFHFPAFPPLQAVPGYETRRVAPFGNPRIEALLAAPRGISLPHASFIGSACQGIHQTPPNGHHTRLETTNSSPRQHINTLMITKRSNNIRSHRTRSPGSSRNAAAMNRSSRPLSSSQATAAPGSARTPRNERTARTNPPA